MSIVATLPVFVLSNSYALNGLLGENCRYHTDDARKQRDDWADWVQQASLMRDSTRPGHVFDMRWKKFEQVTEPTLVKALNCLGDEFLKVHNQRIFIKEPKLFSYWQNLRGRMTMLPVKCWMLYKHQLSMRDFLVHPMEAMLDEYIGQEGLNEAHMHLHAFYRPETFWLQDVNNVLEFEYRERTGIRDKKLRRLYSSVHPELTQRRLASRVRLANVIRTQLLQVFDDDDVGDLVREMERVYKKMVRCPDEILLGETNLHLVDNIRDYQNEELKLWHGVFDRIEQKKSYWRDIQFYAHLYLLIQNEYLHLYRHREGRRGFDAFHMVSRHQPPSISNHHYYRTIFRNIFRASDVHESTCIELRLQPDAFIRRAHYLLKWWKEEWQGYRKEKISCLCTYAGADELEEGRIRLSRVPQPIFVLHFSKSNRGKSPSENKRLVQMEREPYATKRNALTRECNRLARFINSYCKNRFISIGIDAAGDELDLPAEVLAPIFRQFERQTGVSHRTYHCGEDFYHLLGGIRAVYDAVKFLDMRCGHRLGHATAIGIRPEQWRSHMPNILCIRQGDYLLDLIFAWIMLGEQDLQARAHVESVMLPLAQKLFPDETVSTHILQDFYEARRLLPQRVKRSVSQGPYFKTMDDEDDLVEEHRQKWGGKGLEYLDAWNYNPLTQQAKSAIVEIERDFLDDVTLLQLQQAVQKLISERNVVLETLPVSNLRISQYDDIRQHHILRWMMVPGSVVPGDYPMSVCMGSDDPGIFVTDIKNEYYHIFANLRQIGLSPAECMVYIKQLNEAGSAYAFRSILPPPDL